PSTPAADRTRACVTAAALTIAAPARHLPHIPGISLADTTGKIQGIEHDLGLDAQTRVAVVEHIVHGPPIHRQQQFVDVETSRVGYEGRGSSRLRFGLVEFCPRALS